MEYAVRIAFVSAELFLFRLLLSLDLVVVVVDGVKDSVRDLRLPPFGDDERKVFVQLLIAVLQLDA